jgi:hypothetical protein
MGSQWHMQNRCQQLFSPARVLQCSMATFVLPALIALVALLVYAFTTNPKVAQVCIIVFAIFAAVCAFFYLSHGSVRI